MHEGWIILVCRRTVLLCHGILATTGVELEWLESDGDQSAANKRRHLAYAGDIPSHARAQMARQYVSTDCSETAHSHGARSASVEVRHLVVSGHTT